VFQIQKLLNLLRRLWVLTELEDLSGDLSGSRRKRLFKHLHLSGDLGATWEVSLAHRLAHKAVWLLAHRHPLGFHSAESTKGLSLSSLVNTIGLSHISFSALPVDDVAGLHYPLACPLAFWEDIYELNAENELLSLLREQDRKRRTAPPHRNSAQVDGSGTVPAMIPTPGWVSYAQSCRI